MGYAKGCLMGIGRKRSSGDAELDERYLCAVWSL